MVEPHIHRQVAESFGVDPGRYDRARSSYPDVLVTRIVSGSPGSAVLDVGTGTGIVARQFLAAGCTVLGVEPDPRMAEFARGTGVDVEVAGFEDWDAAGRQFDAVVAGTAWHWVDPVAGAAKAAQVLRPRGLLAPFHHVPQSPPAMTGALADGYRRAVPDSPFDFAGLFSKPALETYQPLFVTIPDGIRASGAFTEPEQWRFEWERTYTRDEWLDYLATSGALTRLPADRQAPILETVGAAVDRLGGSVTVPCTTVAVTAVRTGS
jgi:SAM-dependent methyltransferase